MRQSNLLLALLSSVTLNGTSQAALQDRGGGLLYDDVLKITWLQDANYAKTSGFDDDGLMNWNQAMAWADNLSYYDSVRGVTYDDWRLPTLAPVNGASYSLIFSVNGSTDYAYNISAPGSAYPGSTASELAYMYYINLGLKGYYSPDGSFNPNWGIHGNGTWGIQADVGLVKNLQSYFYWAGQEYTPSAWLFATVNGSQGVGGSSSDYAWAVRPGDVAAIPEPDTYAMMLAGFGLLGWISRRRRM